MKGITYNGSEAALIIHGKFVYDFPTGTDFKAKIDQAEAIFCTIPKPDGRKIMMTQQEKQNLRVVDKGMLYEEL